MASVTLGVRSPVDYLTDPDTGLKTKHRWQGIDQSTTQMTLAVEPGDIFGALRDAVNIWAQMSDEAPLWLDCPEDPELEAILRKQFGCGARPDDYEHVISENPILVPVADQLVVPGDATGTVSTAADTADPQETQEGDQ